MLGNGHCFVEWKEEFVSEERGNRVVHYFLRDSAGEFILAVVGTERSVRHMFYVVAEEFVRVYGAENSIKAGYKWRSRREVVDWLTSMLSKQHFLGDGSKSPKHDSAQALGSPECPMNGVSARKEYKWTDFGHCMARHCMDMWLNRDTDELTAVENVKLGTKRARCGKRESKVSDRGELASPQAF